MNIRIWQTEDLDRKVVYHIEQGTCTLYDKVQGFYVKVAELLVEEIRDQAHIGEIVNTLHNMQGT